MTKINLDQSFSTGKNIIARKNQNDTVIIMKTDDNNVFYKIDGIAAHLWTIFQNTVNAKDVLAALVAQFPQTPREQIEADYTNFIAKLGEVGIFGPSQDSVNPTLKDVPRTVLSTLKAYQFGEVKAYDLAQIETEVLNESIYLDVFAGSDLRIKENVTPLENALHKVLALDGVSFTWSQTDAPKGKQIGLVAQQVAAEMPELVKRDENTGVLAVNYTKLMPYLVESIKELKTIIDSQNQKISTLEEELKKLKH